MLKHGSKARVVVTTGAVFTFIFIAAAQGIIGNRADLAFLWMQDEIFKSLAVAMWFWLIILALLLSGFLVVFFWWQDKWRWNQRLNIRNNLIKVDDSLLRLLPCLVSTKYAEHSPNALCLADKTCAIDRNCILECEMHQLIRKFLRDATQVFPKDVHRALLFRPDPASNAEYLTLWEIYGGIDEESKHRKRFYVGPPKAGLKRGVAGDAFYSRKLITMHIVEDNGHWKPDREDVYICFEPPDSQGTDPPYPAYNSLVCIPIVVGGSNDDRLGVLCFDSKNPSVFDPPEVQEMLSLLGTRLATALLTYQELQKISQSLGTFNATATYN